MFTPPPSPRPPSLSKPTISHSPLSSPRTKSKRYLSPSPSPSPCPQPEIVDVDDMISLPMSLSNTSKTSSEPSTPLHLPLPSPSSASDSQIQMKRRIGRRMKWAAILVPLALIFITASTRYISHPTFLDLFSSSSSSSLASLSSSSSWSESIWHDPHSKRQNQLNNSPSSSSIAFPSTIPSPTTASTPSTASTTAATAQPLPTVPSSSSPPDVPKPFPQPFDSDLSTNFSSVDCFNFFQDMLNKLEFRQCRPFGLLLQSSNEFLKAQNNLTLLNTLIWGTCNTNATSSQCGSTMSDFATQLRSQCADDLGDGNARAVGTLIALDAYTLMRTTGCQIDPSTNTYCFVNAVHNANPSDLYYYQLPLGTSLPQSADPTCSACTRSLLGVYAGALRRDAGEDDSSGGDGGSDSDGGSTGGDGKKVLTGLRKTYDAAAQRAVSTCGTGYATLGVVNGSKGRSKGKGGIWDVGTAVGMVVVVWFVVESLL